MIPTREAIDSFAIDHAFHDKMVTWLRSMRSEIDMLRADLDRANAEAALARDALAKATTPEPEREAAIRAWEGCARAQEADDGSFVVWPEEITEAVALMRSAGDGKALLRELRAWIWGEWANQSFGSVPRILNAIDEMLAKPAPVEQPAPTHACKVCGAMWICWPDATWSLVSETCGNCCNNVAMGDQIVKLRATRADGGNHACRRLATPTQVKQPAAAEPDDTRELVAQLADAVVTLCDGQGFGVTLSEVQAIAKQLRGGA